MAQSMAGNRVIAPAYQSTFIQNGAALNWAVVQGPGVLGSLTVGGNTAGTIAIYDAYAATTNPIALFDSTNATALYKFDCAFTNGISIVTSADTYLTCTFNVGHTYDPSESATF